VQHPLNATFPSPPDHTPNPRPVPPGQSPDHDLPMPPLPGQPGQEPDPDTFPDPMPDPSPIPAQDPDLPQPGEVVPPIHSRH
jgi:hypothetical protein